MASMGDMMRYSQKIGCFFPEEINYKDLPDDLIEVSNEEFKAAMARGPVDTLSVSKGKLVINYATKSKQLAFNQDLVWQKIKQVRDEKQNCGVTVDGKQYHSDTQSRIKYLGLLQMSVIPSGLQWKTMDGSFIAMDKELALSIFNAVSALDQLIFSNAETHKAAMLKSKDPLLYDFSTGWPDAP